MDTKKYYTYNDIHNIIFKVKEQIKSFNPDVIVAIGSGGLIPARMIKSYLNVDVNVVSVKSYNKFNISGKIEVVQWNFTNYINKRILVVDDVDDTGKTLSFCIDKLRKTNKARDIGVFVIHNKDKEKYSKLKDVSYMSGETVSDSWIVYPWDTMELFPNNPIISYL